MNVRWTTADATVSALTVREAISAPVPSASGWPLTARSASVGGVVDSRPSSSLFNLNGMFCADNNECSLRNGHGPCQGTCRNTYGSYVCDCDGMTGTQLASDGHTCEDIDECAATGDNFGCSHSCLNTVGTAFCACPEGYMLGDDWKTCEGNFTYL